MPRIVGVDIPNDKSIWISLTYIVGIGKFTSGQILKEAGIDKATKAGKLSEEEVLLPVELRRRACVLRQLAVLRRRVRRRACVRRPVPRQQGSACELRRFRRGPRDATQTPRGAPSRGPDRGWLTSAPRRGRERFDASCPPSTCWVLTARP